MSSNTLQNYHPGMITYATPSQPTGFLQSITSACPLLSLPLQNRSVQRTKTNLEKRKDAECGACEDKKRIATRAKQLNLDAIHDTVHEMCKDEARHGKGFEGLYNRYFK